MNLFHAQLTPGPRYCRPSSAIQAVFFDVDNTLVPDRSAALPTRAFAAKAKQAEEHIPIALTSSRPLQKVAHILEYLNLRGISILSNGAQLYDAARGKMIVERPLNIATTIEIAQELKRLGVNHWIQDDGYDYRPAHQPAKPSKANSSGLQNYMRPKSIWQPHLDTIMVKEYMPHKPFVIVAHNVPAPIVPKIQALAALYARQNVTSLVGHEEFQPDGTVLYDIFILDKLANKKAALLEVSDHLGIPVNQMMIVGDGPNDSEVMASAGIGVAMGNAVEETLAVATHIAPPRVNDGAAAALEWLLASPHIARAKPKSSLAAS